MLHATTLFFLSFLVALSTALPIPEPFGMNGHSHTHTPTRHSFLPTRYSVIPDTIIERFDFSFIPNLPFPFSGTVTDSSQNTSGYRGPQRISLSFSDDSDSVTDPDHPNMLLEESAFPHLKKVLDRVRVYFPPVPKRMTMQADKIDYVDRPVPPPELARKMGWIR